MAKSWSKEEEDFLKKHYRKMSIEDLAEKFGVSPAATRKKEKNLGLLREHSPLKQEKKKKKVAPPVFRKWTEKEEGYLGKHYLKKTNAELAERFGTTAKSVEKKLWRMGWKRRRRTAKDREEERRRRIEEFLERKRPVVKEKKVDGCRSRAIAEFDVAIRLYYDKKYNKAVAGFEKVIKDYADIGDIVYKAKQYIEFCLDKK